MASVSIHGPTGVLVVDGQKVFPIGLSDPPPHDALAPSGQHAFQELANAGATMIRTGTPDWALVRINHQIAAEKAIQDAAAAHGLHCWMRLGPVAEPARCRGQRAAPDQGRRGLQGPSRAVRLQGRRRAAQPVPRRELDPPGRAREGAQGLKRARSRASARHHPGAARPGLAADRLPAGLRHHGRRHLPGRPIRPACTATTATPTSASSAT